MCDGNPDKLFSGTVRHLYIISDMKKSILFVLPIVHIMDLQSIADNI